MEHETLSADVCGETGEPMARTIETHEVHPNDLYTFPCYDEASRAIRSAVRWAGEYIERFWNSKEALV